MESIAPAYSITGRRNNYSYDPVPGPGDYQIDTDFYKLSTKHSFPHARKLELKPKNVPGPGAYSIPSTLGGSTGPILSGRYSPEKDIKVPGPGDYSPALNEKAPQYSFGIKAETKINDVPGPGAYQPKKKTSSPKAV